MADAADNLGSKLDALMANIDADAPAPPEPSEPNAASQSTEPKEAVSANDAGEAAEQAVDQAQDLASKLDAMIQATTEVVPEPSAEPAEVPDTQDAQATADPTDGSQDLASKLDAMLQAGTEAPTPQDTAAPEPDAAVEATENASDLLDQVGDEVDELLGDFVSEAEVTGRIVPETPDVHDADAAAVETVAPEPVKPAETPTPPAATASTPDQEPDDELLGDFVSEAELNKPDTPVKPAEATAQADASETAEAVDDELAGDFVSEAELNGTPDEAVEQTPSPVEPVAQVADAQQPVAEQAEPEEPEPQDEELAGDFVSEAELLDQIDEQLESAATEQIEEETEESDFGALASMLGIDEEEIAAIPPVENPEPVAQTDDAIDEVLDDLEGAFASVDDLLAEMNPAQDTQEASAEDPEDDDSELAGDFAAYDEMDEAQDELGGAFEPVATEEADTPDVDLTMAKADPVPVATAQAQPQASEQASEEPAAPPTDTKTNADARTGLAQRIKPHVQRGKTVAIKLRPHLITLARLSLKGGKAGCYYANLPLDIVADKLAKEDAPPPPIKQYVGMVAAAILIPGSLLLLLGLLG